MWGQRVAQYDPPVTFIVLCSELLFEELEVIYTQPERVRNKINISTIVLCENVIQSVYPATPSPYPLPHIK